MLTPDNSGSVLTAYNADLGPGVFAAGGMWSLSSPSGTAGPLGATFTMPPEVAWGNFPTNANIPRNQDLVVQWLNGGGSPVTIEGASLDDTGRGEAFVCQPPAGQGQFTVPKSILGTLPSSTQIGTASALTTMGVTASGVAPMQTATGLDGGVILFSNGTRLDALFQ